MVAATAVGADEVVLYVKRSDPRVWAAVAARASTSAARPAPAGPPCGSSRRRQLRQRPGDGGDRAHQRQAGAADDRPAAAVRARRRQPSDASSATSRRSRTWRSSRATAPTGSARSGSPTQPGSVLVTLGGAVERPGVYEIAFGSRLADLLRAAGGVIERPQALLVGGYGGAWLDAQHMAGPHAERGRSAARRRLDRSRRPLGPRRGLVRRLGVGARPGLSRRPERRPVRTVPARPARHRRQLRPPRPRHARARTSARG